MTAYFDEIFLFDEKFFIATNNVKSMHRVRTTIWHNLDKIWPLIQIPLHEKEEHTEMTAKNKHVFVSAEIIHVILIKHLLKYECIALTSIL